MKIKAKRITDTAKLPTYGSERAACMDLYADLSDHCITLNPDVEVRNISGNENGPIQRVGIAPHSTIKIPTGWAFQPPEGYMLQILQRSGLASKGLIPIGGIVDNDYNSEIVVILLNTSDDYIFVNNRDRVAQMAVRKYYQAEFDIVDELEETARGGNGFGSTGE